MTPRLVKMNELGRRIGESHPRAVLTDYEVERLLMPLLEARQCFIAEKVAQGLAHGAIGSLLAGQGLSYGLLAIKFEVSKSHIAKIDQGLRRCQTAVLIRACP